MKDLFKIEGSPVRRCILFIVSLFFVALGIRLSLIAALGTGPSTAFSAAMSKIVGKDVAFWLFLINVLCVVIQIVIYGKKFNPFQLIQVAASLVFSLFVAYVDPLVSWWTPSNYFVRLIQLLLSIALQAFGVLCVVKAGIIRMPMECSLIAIQTKIPLKVGTLKILFDLFWLLAALILSGIYLLVHDSFTIASFTSLAGIREGTFITALLTGLFINFFDKLCGKQVAALCGMKG